MRIDPNKVYLNTMGLNTTKMVTQSNTCIFLFSFTFAEVLPQKHVNNRIKSKSGRFSRQGSQLIFILFHVSFGIISNIPMRKLSNKELDSNSDQYSLTTT